MKIENERGSITIFVLIGLLFMASFLMISYGYNVNKSKMAKEQFNTISDIYSYKDEDENAYDRAYTALRKKNKQQLTYNSETEGLYSASEIELEKTYEAKISNYKIYGSILGVGDLITDTTDANYGKYKIVIQVTSKEYKSSIYNIYLSNPLQESGTLVDYIDYEKKKIVRQVSSQTEESIVLPEMSTYEDYTKIEVLTDIAPSKIEIEYTGYTFE